MNMFRYKVLFQAMAPVKFQFLLDRLLRLWVCETGVRSLDK